MNWRFLHPALAEIVHLRQVAEHGGRLGVRDEALLDSARHRPAQKAHYGMPTVAELAASHAFGIIRNHPFFDGNKRVGLVLALTFLRLNGSNFQADPEELYGVIDDVAASRTGEPELAAWFESRIVPA